MLKRYVILKSDMCGILSSPAGDVHEWLKTHGKAIKIVRDY